MSVYIELFHGRKSPSEEMSDWGEPGPVLGPLDFVHTTYAGDVKVRTAAGVDGVLYLHEDMVFYDGMWYGDWSVFSQSLLHPEHRGRMEQFDQDKSMAEEDNAQMTPEWTTIELALVGVACLIVGVSIGCAIMERWIRKLIGKDELR